MSLMPLGGHREPLERAVLAVNDARNLADALHVNLKWLCEALSPARMSTESQLLAREAAEVCLELTRLLGGALGSCKRATRGAEPQMTTATLVDLLTAAKERMEHFTGRAGTIVIAGSPPTLGATVDSAALQPVLDGLLLHALQATPEGRKVSVSYTRSGASAVLAVTDHGPPLSARELRRLHAMADVESEDEAPPSDLDSILGSWRALLAGQGGYLDAESHSDGGTTFFVILPAVLTDSDEPAASGTGFASPTPDAPPMMGDSSSHSQRSGEMTVQSDRFGPIEVDQSDILCFPSGIIGFSKETEFILVRRRNSEMVGWLQSTTTSWLALPVVSAHVLAPRYPDVAIEEVAERIGLGNDAEQLAVLVVMSAPVGQPATVNLMAPIIVNAATRTGAQVLLEGTRFGTREIFVLPPSPRAQVLEGATAMPPLEAEPPASEATASSSTSAAE